MLAGILTICGAALMLFGTVMLTACVAGKPGGVGSRRLGGTGQSRSDRRLLDLYFIAAVVLPLLGGAVMIALGLREWL